MTDPRTIFDGIGSLAASLSRYNGATDTEMTSIDDVYAELVDVAIAALVAVARLGGDPVETLAAKVDVMVQRYAELDR